MNIKTNICRVCGEECDSKTHTKKCQGCQRNLACDKYSEGRKRCDVCCNKRATYKTCAFEGCSIHPSYGKEGSKIREFCKKHAPIGYVDVAHKRCKHESCHITPIYGKPGTKEREFCKSHAPVGYIDVLRKTCKNEACKSRALYGKDGSKIADYCSHHAPKDYVNVVDKTCKYNGCKTQPSFGKKGSKLNEYCKKHAPEGYIDVISKLCEYENCTTRPTYGKEGSKHPEFCVKHAPKGFIDVHNHDKICKHEGCKIRSNYGKEGTKRAEFCVKHAPSNYVNVTCKTCKHEGCKTNPSFSKEGFKIREYCRQHAPKGYVDVVSKMCQYEGCNVMAAYGNKDSKIREYCKNHASAECIYVAKDACDYENCKIRAYYGTPSFKITKNCTSNVLNELTNLDKPTRCAKHKQDGMIPIRKCIIKNCKKSALYGTNKPIHCEEHKNSNDIDLIERECKQCKRIGTINADGLCWDFCISVLVDDKAKMYKKRQTTKQNRIEELLKKEIHIPLSSVDTIIDSMCPHRRPDFVYDVGTHIVIVEVDENAGQKKSYHKEHCEKERIRMLEIAGSFSLENSPPVIFIRYNPDAYHINDKLLRTPQDKRENILIKWIMKAFKHDDFHRNPEQYVPTTLTVYLFYDEYDESISNFKELSQEGLTKGLIPCG